MEQSAQFNSGRKGNLLRGSGTRMGLWFYAFIRLLRLKAPLKATIHQQKFRDLDINERARQAIRDIENDSFFKAVYVLSRAVFPALRALRLCDTNTPSMDKILYLVMRVRKAIELSVPSLNDANIFDEFDVDADGLSSELSQVFGEEGDDE